MRSIRIRRLIWSENNHMQMIVVHSAAIETSGKQGIYVVCFGIPTKETIKDNGISNKYQHFVLFSFHSFLRVWAVTMIHFAMSVNTLRSPEAVTCRCSSIFFLNLIFLQLFTRKHLCWSLFFNEVASLKAYSFFKKRLQDRCFPVNIAKLLGTVSLIEHLL